MKLAFFMGLFLTATLFSYGQTEKSSPDQKSTQKKLQRIKVVMNKNGKETKIDTTFNFVDQKMIRDKVDSIMVKLEMEGIDPDDSTCVFRHGGKRMHWSHLNGKNFPNEEEFEMFIEDGDTGKVKTREKDHPSQLWCERERFWSRLRHDSASADASFSCKGIWNGPG